jgi:hypothetical protein
LTTGEASRIALANPGTIALYLGRERFGSRGVFLCRTNVLRKDRSLDSGFASARDDGGALGITGEERSG